ncbi:hypothetical protein [Tautonia marina]|uniref:hypothetical protein n=1 Tax=Tautonia marina TaxID=2653855 RepID=UPI001260A52E|nr:hypothetical protein [Tautonia marina]
MVRNIITSIKGSRKLQRWRKTANREAWQLQRDNPLEVPFHMKPIARQFARDGLAVFSITKLTGGKELLDGLRKEFREGCHRLADEIESKQNALLSPHDEKDGSKGYIVQFRPWEDSPQYQTALGQLALHPDIISLVNHYFHLYSKVMTPSYWNTLVSGSATPRSSQQWHRDYEDVQVVKAFVYLNDVDDGNGPFHYMRKTHAGVGRWTNPKTWRDSEGGVRAHEDDLFQVFDPQRCEKITGTVGTMFIADTKGYHRGGLAIDRTRELAFTSYKSPIFQAKGLSAPFENLPENVHPAIRFAAQP